jgi:DNA-binding transcriptional regulator YiaG
MNKGLLIKEPAEQLGVSEDTVINWEVRGRRPRSKKHMKILKKFILRPE